MVCGGFLWARQNYKQDALLCHLASEIEGDRGIGVTVDECHHVHWLGLAEIVLQQSGARIVEDKAEAGDRGCLNLSRLD